MYKKSGSVIVGTQSIVGFWGGTTHARPPKKLPLETEAVVHSWTFMCILFNPREQSTCFT